MKINKEKLEYWIDVWGYDLLLILFSAILGISLIGLLVYICSIYGGICSL